MNTHPYFSLIDEDENHQDLHPKEDLTHGDEGIDDPQPATEPPDKSE